MTFEVGDVVVCVDAKIDGRDRITNGDLVEGRRYRIRGSHVCPVMLQEAWYVDEITCEMSHRYGLEYGFWGFRFRKITGADERLRVEEMRREGVTK